MWSCTLNTRGRRYAVLPQPRTLSLSVASCSSSLRLAASRCSAMRCSRSSNGTMAGTCAHATHSTHVSKVHGHTVGVLFKFCYHYLLHLWVI